MYVNKITCFEINNDLNVMVLGFESGKISIVNKNHKIIFNFKRQSDDIINIKIDPLQDFSICASADGSYVFISFKLMTVIRIIKDLFINIRSITQRFDLIKNISINSNSLLRCLLANKEILIFTN